MPGKILLITLTILLTALTAGFAQTKTVLFVCEKGTSKSVIAASYFNKLAKERNLDWSAMSCGADPASSLPAPVSEGLKKDNVPVSWQNPKKVTQADMSNSQVVVLLNNPLPGQPTVTTNVKQWDNLPSVSENYDRARDSIVLRVNSLLDSLSKHRSYDKKN